MVSNIDLGIGYAHYLSDGIINASQNYSAPCSGLGINLNLGLEYKFNVNWGVKISISGEYYHFKDIHKVMNIVLKHLINVLSLIC